MIATFAMGLVGLAPMGAHAAELIVDTVDAATAFTHVQCLTGTIEGAFGEAGTPITEADARADDGDVSLGEAICLANVDDAADTIVLFDDDFVLTAIDNRWYGPNGLPPVFTPITIEGNGARIVRDGGEGDVAFRFFYVAGPFHNLREGKPAAATPGTLVLCNLTLAGGLFRGGNSENGGGGAGMGGAIFNQGTLTLDGVTAHDNRAEGGSAVGFGSNVNARIGGGGLGGDGGAAGGGFGGPGGHMGGETGLIGQAGTSRFGGNGAWGQDGGHGGGFVANGAQAPGDGGGGSGPANDRTGGGGAFGGGGGRGGSVFSNGGTGGGGGAGAGGGKGGSARPAAGVTNAGGRGGDGGFGGGGGGGGGLSGGLGDAGTVPGVGGAGGFGGGGGGGGAGLVASRVSIAAGGVEGGSGGYGGGGGGGSSGVVEVKDGSGGGGAGMGGVVFNHAGTLTIVNCTLSGNQAIGGDSATDGVYGGGGGKGLGGAIFNLNGYVLVSHATVIDNGVRGGVGFVSGGGELSDSLYNVLHTTGVGHSITGGTGALVVRNTIVDRCVNDDGEVTLEGHTLIVTSEGCGTPTSTAAPELSPLADNGGPSETRAPSATSSVLHAADPAFCRDGTSTGAGRTDQRGFARREGSCDLGAFEEQASALAIVSGDDQEALAGATLDAPLVVRATRELGEGPLVGGFVTFTGPASGPGIAAFTPGALATTDEDGEASVSATLGDEPGSFVVIATAGNASVELSIEARPNEVEADAEGAGSEVTETGAEAVETEVEAEVEAKIEAEVEHAGAETADEGPSKSSGGDDGCTGAGPLPTLITIVMTLIVALARRRQGAGRAR